MRQLRWLVQVEALRRHSAHMHFAAAWRSRSHLDELKLAELHRVLAGRVDVVLQQLADPLRILLRAVGAPLGRCHVDLSRGQVGGMRDTCEVLPLQTAKSTHTIVGRDQASCWESVAKQAREDALVILVAKRSCSRLPHLGRSSDGCHLSSAAVLLVQQLPLQVPHLILGHGLPVQFMGWAGMVLYAQQRARAR